MSLVSLTFGSGKAQSVSPIRMFVQKPLQNLKVNPNEENRLEVLKASQFFGHLPEFWLNFCTKSKIRELFSGSGFKQKQANFKRRIEPFFFVTQRYRSGQPGQLEELQGSFCFLQCNGLVPQWLRRFESASPHIFTYFFQLPRQPYN